MRRVATLAAMLAVLAVTGLAPAPAVSDDRIRVELNMAQLIRLDRNANVVMVADPNVVDPVVESPRLIFLIGRAVGDTNIHILDDKGAEILVARVNVYSDIETQISYNRGALTEATYSCTPRCRYVATPSTDMRFEDYESWNRGGQSKIRGVGVRQPTAGGVPQRASQ